MFDCQALRARLGDQWPDVEIRALGSVSSTNDIAWAWADARCPEWTCFFAEEQVRGRGRFGRAWHSPRGRGLLMSVVLRPASPLLEPAGLTAIAALAVAEAIEDVAGLPAGLDWPNDVVVGGKKVAGILVERRGEPPSPCVLGIGVNVNTRPEEFAPALRPLATSLAAEAGREFSREDVAAAILERLHSRYRRLAEGGRSEVAAEWVRRCGLLGLEATVRLNGAQFRGTIVGVDPLDGIELELAGGLRRKFPPGGATLEVEGRR